MPPGTVAVLSSAMLGLCTIGTDAESLSFASASAAPWAVVTEAVLLYVSAGLTTPPLSISACVTVWFAV